MFFFISIFIKGSKCRIKFKFYNFSISFNRAEREQDPVDNNRVSKLLVPDEHNEDELTLSQPARQLCASIDAFVYAVRADDINKGKAYIPPFPYWEVEENLLMM